MKPEGRAVTLSRDSPTENCDGRNKRHICPKCGLFINSEESLKVHMQYQHDNMSRWGAPTSIHSGSLSITTTSQQTPSLTTLTSNVSETGAATSSGGSITTLSNLSSKSPTDPDNNNHHQKNKQNQLHQQVSPLHNNSNANTSNTVSAAADSSNNQSPTPVTGGADQGASHSFNVSNSYQGQQGNNLIQDMHPYNPYVHGYDFPPHPMMDSSMYPMPYQTGTEYKTVPSNRYHPYHTPNHMHPANQATTNGTNPSSSSASNSSLSPRVVSSSSPTQNSIMGQSGPQDSNAMTHIPQGQPTPSPSPKQCDKCGYVCQTDAQLSEHYTTTHGIQQNDATNRPGGTTDEGEMQNQYSYQPYIKEEPSSDILDLDSQKMIYPATATGPVSQESLPSMHSVHAMHRSSLMWGPEMHTGYMPHSQPDIKQSYFPPMRPPYPIKQEYSNMKQDYTSGPAYGTQVIKPEFNAHHQPIIPQTRPDIKSFTTDINTGSNPTTSSPSEFPSTTTPQDNGSQFRGFEPPTSSLPNNAPTTKSATWKSNEARRPKTYNCTACNKWFTSSGHLKRHYNTTLHKNAVKSSGQPDPATMPISAHHHPSRDPNSKHHRNNQSQQPPPAPPEPPRSPEYTPQYTPPPVGFTQSTGSFQQYNPSAVSIHSNGHPNGQAGPSVHASQQRDLLTLTTMEAMCNQHQGDHSLQAREEQYHQVLEQQTNPGQQLQQGTHFILEHHMSDQQDTMSPHTISSMGHHYIINHLPAINTPSTTQSFQRMLQVEAQQNLPTITGNDSQMDPDQQNLHIMDSIAYDPSTNEQLQIATIHQIQTTEDGHQISHITTLNPSSIVELHRLSRSQDSIVYPQHVPEILPGSPQEADIAPQQQAGHAAAGTGSPNLPSSTILVIPISPPDHHRPQQIGDNSSSSSETGSSKPSSPSSMSPTGDPGTVSTASPTKTGKVECRECGKEFAKACYLTQHNKTLHSGEQPFRCQKCGKRFQTQDTYDIHLDKHKCKDKPYKCDTCPKQFHHKTDLRRHKDGHTGYKAHVCDTCNKGFCRKDHLRKHCDTHKPKPQKIAKKTHTSN